MRLVSLSRTAWIPWLAVFLVFSAFLGAGCSGRGTNVLLVTVAGLRTDAVEPGRTPHLAALPGRVSPDVVVPVPDTAVALEALVTGRGLGQLENRFGDIFRVSPGARTLAERLAGRGLRRVAFVGDGRLSELAGFARGFEEYHCPSGTGDVAVLTDELARLKPRAGGSWTAEQVRDAVGAWLSQHAQERPFFLWVHLGDLSAAARESDPRAAYATALEKVDAAVGDIVGALRTYGIDGKTTVAVVSLHGEALGVRGETGHGIFLSSEVIRVPAWLAAPGGEPVATGDRTLDLGSAGRALARAAGLEVREGVDGEPRSATWWPSRLYGWPDDAPPGNAPEVLGKMAEAHRLALGGERAQARAVLRRVAEMAPRGLTPRVVLARELAAAARAAQGSPAAERLATDLEKVLAECRELAGDDLPREFDLVRLLVSLGRNDEALALAGRMEGKAETAGELLALAQVYAEAGASERAAEMVGRLATGESAPAPELWTWQGDLLRRAGNSYQARQAYEKAIASPRGHTANTLAKLGDCLASLGEQDAALERYAEAVRLDPTYRYPHARAAEILLEQGREGEAATALAMSVPEGDDPIETAVTRARRMLEKGLLGPAALELTRALEEHPGNAKLTGWLARTYIEAGKLKAARELLDQVLERRPDNPLAWEERARLAVLEGNTEEALRCLRRAETYASPTVVELVRGEPLFRRDGPDTPLARLADRFGVGRRPRRPVRRGEAGR